jgi:hypothetical protein
VNVARSATAPLTMVAVVAANAYEPHVLFKNGRKKALRE